MVVCSKIYISKRKKTKLIETIIRNNYITLLIHLYICILKSIPDGVRTMYTPDVNKVSMPIFGKFENIFLFVLFF